MPLPVKSEHCLVAHAWFDMHDLGAKRHYLPPSVALQHNPLKINFLLAPIVEFLKCAPNRDREIAKPAFKSRELA